MSDSRTDMRTYRFDQFRAEDRQQLSFEQKPTDENFTPTADAKELSDEKNIDLRQIKVDFQRDYLVDFEEFLAYYKTNHPEIVEPCERQYEKALDDFCKENHKKKDEVTPEEQENIRKYLFKDYICKQDDKHFIEELSRFFKDQKHFSDQSIARFFQRYTREFGQKPGYAGRLLIGTPLSSFIGMDKKLELEVKSHLEERDGTLCYVSKTSHFRIVDSSPDSKTYQQVLAEIPGTIETVYEFSNTGLRFQKARVAEKPLQMVMNRMMDGQKFSSIEDLRLKMEEVVEEENASQALKSLEFKPQSAAPHEEAALQEETTLQEKMAVAQGYFDKAKEFQQSAQTFIAKAAEAKRQATLSEKALDKASAEKYHRQAAEFSKAAENCTRDAVVFFKLATAMSVAVKNYYSQDEDQRKDLRNQTLYLATLVSAHAQAENSGLKKRHRNIIGKGLRKVGEIIVKSILLTAFTGLGGFAYLIYAIRKWRNEGLRRASTKLIQKEKERLKKEQSHLSYPVAKSSRPAMATTGKATMLMRNAAATTPARGRNPMAGLSPASSPAPSPATSRRSSFEALAVSNSGQGLFDHPMSDTRRAMVEAAVREAAATTVLASGSHPTPKSS